MPFPLLVNNKERWQFVISNGLFVILFINIYAPFNMTEWPGESLFIQIVGLSAYGIVGVVVLVISQFLLRPLFKLKSFNLGGYILWFLFELTLLTTIMTFLFSEWPTIPLIQEWVITLKYTFSTALISYFSCLIILRLFQKSETISNEIIDTEPQETLTFKHENGKTGLVIRYDDFLYLKSADNYVEVHFLLNGVESSELIRNNLKWFENNLCNDSIIRTHRSYILNTQKIQKVSRSKGGYKIRINQHSFGVSESYKLTFEKALKIESSEKSEEA